MTLLIFMVLKWNEQPFSRCQIWGQLIGGKNAKTAWFFRSLIWPIQQNNEYFCVGTQLTLLVSQILLHSELGHSFCAFQVPQTRDAIRRLQESILLASAIVNP